MKEHRERELKFELPQEWQLPDVTELTAGGGSATDGQIQLASTYYDTTERDLLARGITLRRRTGDVDEGWQLKVPEQDGRTELQLPLDGTRVPAELARLTTGVRRGAPLAAVARIRTDRAVHRVADADGKTLIEVAVDEVEATQMGTTAVATTWREAEVEIVDGTERDLQRAAKWLARSGATRSTAKAKLERALAWAPLQRDWSSKTLTGALRDYLAAQHDAILAGDVELRRGHDRVHASRVATRRYRSVLRVFADRFDTDRAAYLDAELKWYAGLLGEVRDRQVLRPRLDDAVAELPRELVLGPVAARIDQTLDAETAAAMRRLTTAMKSRRYLDLLQELSAWSKDPPLIGADGHRRELAGYLDRTERKARKRLRRAEQLDPDDADQHVELHRARKAAKRARYIAELSEPALGKRAHVAVKKQTAVQDRLGSGQDALFAAQFLRRAAAATAKAPNENGFTFGVLWERLRPR